MESITKSKLRIVPFNEVMNDTTPEPTHIISGGILPQKALLLITGQPKARKSFLIQNLALSIASGRSFACFKIEKPKKVLLLSAEGGYYSNRDRVQKMARNINFMNTELLNICFDSRIKFDDESDVILLREKINDYQPQVVIIDPLVKFHSKDENSANEMAPILNLLRELIEDLGISIILVHHQGKDSSKGGRGTSAIQGEYDSHIKISNTKNGHNFEFDLRHAAPMNDLQITFNPETFWFEQDKIHPLIKLVDELPGLIQKRIAEKAVENKLFGTEGGASKALKKLVENGAIKLSGKKLYPNNYPISNLRGD